MHDYISRFHGELDFELSFLVFKGRVACYRRVWLHTPGRVRRESLPCVVCLMLLRPVLLGASVCVLLICLGYVHAWRADGGSLGITRIHRVKVADQTAIVLSNWGCDLIERSLSYSISLLGANQVHRGMVLKLEVTNQTLHIISTSTLGLPDVELFESNFSGLCAGIIRGILDTWTRVWV